MVLAAISAKTSSTPPYKKLSISIQRILRLMIRRKICGMNKPTKPIFPATATHIAHSGIMRRITFFFKLPASTPSVIAASSPSASKATLSLRNANAGMQSTVTAKRPQTELHCACRNPPAIQKASSWERFCSKAVRDAAERKRYSALFRPEECAIHRDAGHTLQ